MQARGTLQGNSDSTKIKMTSTEIYAACPDRKYTICSISPVKLTAYFLKIHKKHNNNNNNNNKTSWKEHN